MRVLLIAAQDTGGSLYYLTQELRRRRLADVRLVVLDASAAAGFPTDIAEIHDGGTELVDLIERAQVLHFVDVVPDRVRILETALADYVGLQSRRRVVVHLDGRLSAADTRNVHDLVQARGWGLVATRPGLAAQWGAHFVPPFIPWWRAPWTPLAEGTRARESLRRPGIVFVSSLVPLQQNRVLEQLVDRAEAHTNERLRLEVMTALPHRHVLRRRRSSHLVLTASNGLGRNALESLCQGVPVVANLDHDLARSYAALSDDVPPPIVTAEELDDTIAAIDPRRPPDLALRDWATRLLDPQRWFDLCTALWQLERRAA